MTTQLTWLYVYPCLFTDSIVKLKSEPRLPAVHSPLRCGRLDMKVEVLSKATYPTRAVVQAEQIERATLLTDRALRGD